MMPGFNEGSVSLLTERRDQARQGARRRGFNEGSVSLLTERVAQATFAYGSRRLQ